MAFRYYPHMSSYDQSAVETIDHGFPVWASTILCLGVFAIGSEALLVSPLLKDIAASFGVRGEEAGLAVSIYGLALAIAAPLIGMVSDRLPRRSLMIGGLLVFALATIGCALARDFTELLAARALCGLAAGAYLPASYAYVGDEAPYSERGKIMGRILFGWAAAMVLGVPLGGMLGEWLGWRGAFGAVAVLGLAVVPAIMRLRTSRQAMAQRAGGIAMALATPRVKLILAINFLNMFGFYGLYTYLGTALRDLLSLGSGMAGGLVVFYGLGVAAVTLNGQLLDRVGKMRALPVLLLVLAGLQAAMGWGVGNLWVVAPLMLGWGMLQGATLTCVTTIATQQSEAARGAIMALVSCTSYLAVTVGAAAMGPVYGALGFVPVCLTCAIATLGAAALVRYRLQRS